MSKRTRDSYAKMQKLAMFTYIKSDFNTFLKTMEQLSRLSSSRYPRHTADSYHWWYQNILSVIKNNDWMLTLKLSSIEQAARLLNCTDWAVKFCVDIADMIYPGSDTQKKG